MKNLACILSCLALALLMSCHRQPASDDARRLSVDALNERAYAWLYRDVDSVRRWSAEAQSLAEQIRYTDGLAEALNNHAFERFQQMDFDSVLVLAQEIEALSPANTERLVAEVMQMKVAQRTSDNLAFFVHRSQALRLIDLLKRDEPTMSAHTHRRFAYGCSEAHIVASTYFYYLNQQERAIAEIREAEPYCTMPEDTAQWLNYCYMRGSGGLSEQPDAEGMVLEEFGFLHKSFWLSRYEGYRFFEANTEQSLATLFADSARLAVLQAVHPEQLILLTTIFGNEDTALQLAEAAYENFVRYDDLYQEACAMRTLGELAFERGEYEEAIQSYAKALACVNLHHLCYYAPDEVLETGAESDLLQTYNPLGDSISVERRWMLQPHVKTVPEWIAGIRQQLSVAYSALDCTDESNYNRNIYLDLLDITREDAELESRAAELKAESQRFQWLIIAVIVLAVVVGLLTYFLIRAYRRRTEAQNRLLNQQYLKMQQEAQREQEVHTEEREQLLEQQAATEQRLQRDKRNNIEKRAKLQLVNAIVPFLDRIIHEVHRMERNGSTNESSLAYINELTGQISQYNDLLTQWIQMEQGQLSLQLTSFPLAPLFESLRKSHYAYDQNGLTLTVQDTDLSVKADRALTLFMLNTLADNARKFTSAGGSVTISAAEGENADGRYVELSVQDTGCGISEADIDLILNHKVYDAALIGHTPRSEGQRSKDERPTVLGPSAIAPMDENRRGRKGFGFGLINCKGIIEKYRKTNPLFRVCALGIESRVGEGSRFWFRLPRVATVAALLLCSWNGLQAQEQLPERVYEWADSIYVCDVNERYVDVLRFAETALEAISPRLTLSDNGREPVELQWWRQQQEADYDLLLFIRNEVAVAALALHDWPLYRYNNRIYSQLYKLKNQDATLEAFCLQTQRSQQLQRWGLAVIVALLLFGAVAAYVFYFLPRVRFRRKFAAMSARRLRHLQETQDAERERQQADFEIAEDEHRRRLYEEERLHVQNQIIDNCLSTIKHETMYYPGRIQQLVLRGGDLNTLSETATYYKEVYSLLSAQAAQQAEIMNFRRRKLTAQPLLESLEKRLPVLARRCGVEATLTLSHQLGDKAFYGDPDLLQMLLETLVEGDLSLAAEQKNKEKAPLPLTLSTSSDGRFARFTLTNPSVPLTEEQLQNLFMPHEGGIPWLICKQIIRENDTFLGHPGCRICAERVGEGHSIYFTLPVKSDNS